MRTLRVDPAAQQMMQELFKTLNGIELVPRYNIAPTQPVAAIWEESGRREAHFARWGLVPRWVKDPREFPLLVNARVETMAEKPAFRDALKHGRCIIPASGYYEWHTGPDKKKQPYYITLADGAPMALAGLYATWSGPEGEEIDTVATITVPANPQLSAIHDRMPAILRGRRDRAMAGCARRRCQAAPISWRCRWTMARSNSIRFRPGSIRPRDRRSRADRAGDASKSRSRRAEKKKAAGGAQLDLF